MADQGALEPEAGTEERRREIVKGGTRCVLVTCNLLILSDVELQDHTATADAAFGQANVRRVSFHVHRVTNTGDFDHGSAYAGPVSSPRWHSRASSELRDFPALRGRRNSAFCLVER